MTDERTGPDEAVEDRFIESWGSMGVLWGINRSMARVHALVLLSDGPIDLSSIAERLEISRGNASMCLRELRNWGVIHKVGQKADRRDYYVAEPDVWRMFFRIAVERKRREFDPALQALRDLLATSELAKEDENTKRLGEMEQLLSRIDQLANRSLEDEDRSRTILEFVSTTMGK